MVALGPPGVWDRVGHVDFMRFLVEYGLKGFSDRLFEHSTRNALKQFANLSSNTNISLASPSRPILKYY